MVVDLDNAAADLTLILCCGATDKDRERRR